MRKVDVPFDLRTGAEQLLQVASMLLEAGLFLLVDYSSVPGWEAAAKSSHEGVAMRRVGRMRYITARIRSIDDLSPAVSSAAITSELRLRCYVSASPITEAWDGSEYWDEEVYRAEFDTTALALVLRDDATRLEVTWEPEKLQRLTEPVLSTLGVDVS